MLLSLINIRFQIIMGNKFLPYYLFKVMIELFASKFQNESFTKLSREKLYLKHMSYCIYSLCKSVYYLN